MPKALVKRQLEQISFFLKNSGVVIIPTDTIYGIVGTALNPQVVEKIYKLRKRTPSKPMIILISSLMDLEKFEIKVTDKQKQFLNKNWPNPVSIILPCNSKQFEYLHRGTNFLAFRMPKDSNLLELLKKVGPLVAPSANFEGEKPSDTIEEAKIYFEDKVDFYLDGGKMESKPSTLIELNEDGIYTVLREGSYKFNEKL